MIKWLKTELIRSVLLACLPLSTIAQDLTGYNWYFGPQGIEFSRADGSATLIDSYATPGAGTIATAVASSSVNGDVFFYTDGKTIFDVTNAAMPNGTGLGAENARQSVVVGKVPGSDTQYYVFVRDAGGTVTYRTVDMSLAGNAAGFPAPPLGAATSASNTPVTGLTARSDAMITVPHANGDSFWIVTHANGSPEYTVTLVTPAGPTSTTTFSNIGLISNASNFTYNPTTNQIAVAPADANRDVEIVNFDPATGQITFQQQVTNSAVNSPDAISDVEWSTNGEYLYISREGGGGVQADLLQYNLTQPSITAASVLPQPNTIFRSYGLQMAPDSSIYHLYQATSGGPILMGKVSDTDSIAANVIYNRQAFPGNQTYSTTQFSSFAPRDTVPITVNFTANGLCANAPTAFFPNVDPNADSLRWDFGNGSGSGDWSPVFTYEEGGSYNVTVTAYLNGQVATNTQPITINDFDTQISLVQDTTACSCELPFPKAPNPPAQCGQFSVTAQVNNGSGGQPQLQWYGPGGLIAGATSETLQPDSAGYYYLVATVGGCSTYAGVNIKEYDVEDQRANIWYFGNQAGIDFNPLPENPAVAITNGTMNAPEGTSTISDRNGQVVFYTDGDKVWNRQNVEIATGIGGSPQSSQSAIIIPVPGDETLYYIFTTKEVYNATGQYEVRYSLFDLKLNGGTGGLVQQNVLLFSRSTERLTGNENWLIAHEYGNNTFRAYQITSNGIASAVISNIGSNHSLASQENAQGYMELGTNNQLAVALSTPGTSNVVELFTFNDGTGRLTNYRQVDLNSPAGQVYGLEFANGVLIASIKNTPSSQLALITLDSASTPKLKVPPTTVNGEVGAIQSGPDGQIYVAVNGASALGTIQVNVSATDTTIVFTDNGFPLLGGTTSTLGLPNFIQNLSDPTQGPSISIVGECIQDSVQFSGTPTDPIDQFRWEVRQAGSVITTSTEQDFAYLFTAPGLYDVTLQLTNRCGLDTTMTQQLRINDVPPDPSRAAVLCTGTLVLDANPSGLPDLSYIWSTGDTTRTITVTRQARYRVTVSNPSGCTTDGQILASDNRPRVDLGDDLTICQNTTLPALDAQNPGATYAWTINGAPSGTTRTHAVNTSVPSPPTFEYEVTVTDPVTSCFVKDSVIYTINPLPVLSAPVTTNPTTCGAGDGTINIDIVSPAGATFTYSVTGPSTSVSGTDRSVGPIPTVTSLGAGTYGITVADQISGCATTTSASVNDGAFTVAGATNDICDPMNIDAAITEVIPGSVLFPATYRVIDTAIPNVPAQPVTNISALTFSTDPAGLPSNNRNYIIEVTSNGCVASSAPITINHNQTVPADLTPNLCGNPFSITASQGETFQWAGPGLDALTANMPTMQASPPVGSQVYNVVITQTGFCPLDTAITVNIEPPVVPNIAQSDGCTDQVTITATPNGNYLYRWFRNGTIDFNLGGTEVFADASNNGQQYSVTLYSPVTGCNFSSNALVVQVSGELTVDLTSTAPCEGSAFTLTAAPNAGQTPSYAWAFDGSTISGQTGTTLSDQRAGNFRVTATVGGCTATDQLDIVLNPATPGLMNDQAYICNDPANPDENTRSVTLDPGSENLYNSYDWYKDGVSLGITTATLVADEPGLYSVNLLNQFDCPSSDRTTVIIQCDPVIVGPNAFKPSSGVVGLEGDFVNQNFRLFTFFIDDEDFRVFIFNRWGEMIYTSQDRQFRWNGGYNNNLSQMAPAGTYSYVVQYKSSYRPAQGIQEKRGGVVLMR